MSARVETMKNNGPVVRQHDRSLQLDPFITTALLATLYGAVLANIICRPIADKLHGKLVDEEINRTLIIDGVLMIRESKSPTLVREMLVAYLPEKHRSEDPEAVAA